MVRMHVGDKDAGDGLAFERASKNLAPSRCGLAGLNPRIDDRPAFAVANRPEINVGKGKRQTLPWRLRQK